MAMDIAELLWSKFLKSLEDLESISKSGFLTFSFFSSSSKEISDIMSKFKGIKDFVNERDLMSQSSDYPTTIEQFYGLNDALADCLLMLLEFKKVKNKFSSVNVLRRYSSVTIMDNLNQIECKLKELTVSSEAAESPKPPPSSLQTSPSSVFGLEDHTEKMVNLLTVDSSSSSSSGGLIKKIGVTGMAGVGKTTLVRKVLERKEVKSNYGAVVWLPFSGIWEGEQQYSKFCFKMCIYNGLGEYLETTVGLDTLVNSLQQRLSDKSYLIVLDDVCYQHIYIMERLVSRLPKARGGALTALIVTSRLKEVAQKLGKVAQKLGKDYHPVPLEPLSPEHCSSIIDDTIEEGKKLPLGGKMEKIVNDQCHGLYHPVPLEPLSREHCSRIIDNMIEEGKKLPLGGKMEKIVKDQCHGLPSVAKALTQIYSENLSAEALSQSKVVELVLGSSKKGIKMHDVMLPAIPLDVTLTELQ